MFHPRLQPAKAIVRQDTVHNKTRVAANLRRLGATFNNIPHQYD